MSFAPILKNPYIIGRPIFEPQLFFGREDLFRFITTNLDNGARAILLHGQRRIGKSSVLRQIPNFVHRDRFVIVPFDLQGQTSQPLARVLADLAADILEQLSKNIDVVAPPSKDHSDPDVFLNDFLPLVFKQLHGKRLVLLLDEFDALSNYRGDEAGGHFFPFLQRIISRHEQLQIIAVVGRRLDEIDTLLSLFSGAPSEEIGLLDEKSATRLIVMPAKGRLTFTDDAITAILELSQGHPYFTQLVCHVLFVNARSKGTGVIDRDDVASVVEQAITLGEAGLFWFRDGLPVAERIIFSAVAEAQQNKSSKRRRTSPSGKLFAPPITSIQLSEYLAQHGIVETDLLRRAEERLLEWRFLLPSGQPELAIFDNRQSVSYRVAVEIVRRWVVSRYPLQRVVEELEHLDIFATRLYDEAQAARKAGNNVGALQRYEEALRANPNHPHVILELAEVYQNAHSNEQALLLFDRAYKMNPNRSTEGSVRARIALAQELIEKRDFQGAQQYLSQALKLKPNNKELRAQVSMVETGLRRALVVNNPYIVNRPVFPSEFVGRISEITTIFTQILNRDFVVVSSGPRMGKTSLLRYVANPNVWLEYSADTNGAYIVSIDCQTIGAFNPTNFWREVLLDLDLQLDATSRLGSLVGELVLEPEITRRNIARVLRLIGAENRVLVLLVDEFDAAFHLNENYSEAQRATFLQELRSLSGDPAFSLVVATSRPLMDFAVERNTVFSPFYNVFLTLYLPFFAQGEAAVLLSRMRPAFNVSESEERWISNVSSGHPYLFQLAANIVFKHHAEAQQFDLERAGLEFVSHAERFFSMIWRADHDVEQMLLTIIALTNVELRSSEPLFGEATLKRLLGQFTGELHSLERQGFIIEVQKKNEVSYRLVSPLFDWWIINEIETLTEQEVTEMQGRIGNLVDQHHARSLRVVIQQVRDSKLADSGLLPWSNSNNMR